MSDCVSPTRLTQNHLLLMQILSMVMLLCCRWMTEEGLSGLDKSWIPFGGGVRKCMGYNFAILEIKVSDSQTRCSFLPPESMTKVLFVEQCQYEEKLGLMVKQYYIK